jgi:hypothetical protein
MILLNILMILVNFLIKLYIPRINSEEQLFIMQHSQNSQNVIKFYRPFYKYHSKQLIISKYFILFMTIYRLFNLFNKENRIQENI